MLHTGPPTQRPFGFTLIELLVVIAIIGIIGALLLPQLLRARDGAQYAAARSDLRNMANQLMSCAAQGLDFPDDVSPNVDPSNGTCNIDWPSRVPFNSTYDYENWNIGSSRWIGITFWGRNNNRNGIPANTNLGGGFREHVSGNQITMSIAVETP